MAAKERTIEYEGDGVTVLWKPHLCYHSEKCVKGLPNVFKPKEKRWIQTEHATADELIAQIKQCPSGALGYKTADMENENQNQGATSVTVLENGPLICDGPIKITNPDGSTSEMDKAALCRCGASANKPFCDGSHNKIEFKG